MVGSTNGELDGGINCGRFAARGVRACVANHGAGAVVMPAIARR